MKTAIMQPYVFPYLGYFQLVGAVDSFVFFNDVNYIKKGWINKNQIIQNNTIIKFTIPLSNVSQNSLICDVMISDYTKWRTDFIKNLTFSYKKAPHFASANELITSILNEKDFTSIDELAQISVKRIANYLGLKTNFLISDKIDYNRDQCESGQEKILNITKKLNATSYINPINGQELYDRTNFKENNLELHFIKMRPITYKQFGNNEFIPYMSIIDVLMFNSKEEISVMLKEYDLV